MPRCPYPTGGVRSSSPSPWFFEPVTTGVVYVYLKAIKILRIKKGIQKGHPAHQAYSEIIEKKGKTSFSYKLGMDLWLMTRRSYPPSDIIIISIW
jgi:hypothetical protein